jgi:hypothetical protein
MCTVSRCQWMSTLNVTMLIFTVFSLIEALGTSASAEGRLYCILAEKSCIFFFEASKYLHF